MNREEKAAAVAEIAAQIQEAETVFAVDYRGMSVPEVASLREKLREADATFRVVKNSLSERAADEAGAGEVLRPLLQGPTALTFVRGDAALAAKALADAAKATEHLSFKGGVMNGAPLSDEQVKSIARLPSREVLIGQLVGLVASPLTGLARSLNGLIGGLAVQLGQIQEQGLVGQGAPAAAEAAPAEEPAAEAQAPAEAEAEAEAPAEAEAQAPAEGGTPDEEPEPAEQPDASAQEPAEGSETTADDNQDGGEASAQAEDAAADEPQED